MRIQRETFLDPLDPVENERSCFSANAFEAGQSVDARFDVSLSFHEITCPIEDVTGFEPSVGDTRQPRNEVIARFTGDGIGCGKVPKESWGRVVDRGMGAMGAQDDGHTDRPRVAGFLKDRQRMGQLDVSRILVQLRPQIEVAHQVLYGWFNVLLGRPCPQIPFFPDSIPAAVMPVV